LTAVSFSFAKPLVISKDFRLQFSVLGMRARLEDLEAIIQSEDLLNGCTRDAVLLSEIPVDFRIWSHSIKSAFPSTSIRRPSGAIGNTFKLLALVMTKRADQAF
jgi:hypothetical protein